ncbi:MAG: 4Fe-4S binding protein, partial [Candidatus Competibacterales bacterium]|nr:4Fe-4S binding protein [Candidatus Competibacterales bacterium]
AIEPLVQACGVDFLEVADPYDTDRFRELLREADAYTRRPDGGVAVLVSRHGCIMDPAVRKEQPAWVVTINDKCIGCRKCVDAFECPALLMDADGQVARVNRDRCIGCGTCIPVCPVDAIVKEDAP